MPGPGDDVNLEALLDLATPWCLHVVATLGIADHLAAGSDGIDDLAAATGCDPDALHAVMTHVAGKGVFRQVAPGRFALNPAAEQLRGQAPFLDLYGIGSRFALAWGTLLTFVRTGRPAYHQLFRRPFWEDLETHPHIAAAFDELMGPAGHGVPDYDIDLADGWDGVRAVVDVGGGGGAMLANLLLRHPDVRGTLVDLPATVARAAATFDGAGVADRVITVGQSFFDPLPAGADLYLLKKVLNDWPEPEKLAILRRCAQAAWPSGGRVVVMGGVAPEGAPPRLVLEMLLVGGRTSSIGAFRLLAAEAGLEVVGAGQQASGQYVVECRCAP